MVEAIWTVRRRLAWPDGSYVIPSWCFDAQSKRVSECVWFNVTLPTRHTTGHVGDESFQAIDCTGYNQTTTEEIGLRKTQNQ